METINDNIIEFWWNKYNKDVLHKYEYNFLKALNKKDLHKEYIKDKTVRSMMFLRYIKMYYTKEIWETLKWKKKYYIEALGKNFTTVNIKNSNNIKELVWLISMNYELLKENFQKIRNLYYYWKLKEYNTEDGVLRLIEDGKIKEMNLWHLWSIIPKEIKANMTNWSYINLPYNIWKETRETLLKMNKDWDLKEYNTEDGILRLIEDGKIKEMNLWNLWGIIPWKIRKSMTNWSCINLPYKTWKETRETLLKMNKDWDLKEYNTEDGMLRLIEDGKIREMNLWNLWSIIPQEVKSSMSEWKKINLPYKTWKETRETLLKMNKDWDLKEYNTEDGVLRLIKDGKIKEMHLWQLWSIIPWKIRKSMTNWSCINLSYKIAKEIRETLLKMNKDWDLKEYNTEDGMLRLIEDGKIKDMNLWQLWSIIPQEVKSSMSEWKKIDLSYKTWKDTREILLKMNKDWDLKEYNIEDGVLRLIEDGKIRETHLWNLWSIIPQEVKSSMNEWKKINLPYKTTKDILGKSDSEFGDLFSDYWVYLKKIGKNIRSPKDLQQYSNKKGRLNLYEYVKLKYRENWSIDWLYLIIKVLKVDNFVPKKLWKLWFWNIKVSDIAKVSLEWKYWWWIDSWELNPEELMIEKEESATIPQMEQLLENLTPEETLVINKYLETWEETPEVQLIIEKLKILNK